MNPNVVKRITEQVKGLGVVVEIQWYKYWTITIKTAFLKIQLINQLNITILQIITK